MLHINFFVIATFFPTWVMEQSCLWGFWKAWPWISAQAIILLDLFCFSAVFWIDKKVRKWIEHKLQTFSPHLCMITFILKDAASYSFYHGFSIQAPPTPTPFALHPCRTTTLSMIIALSLLCQLWLLYRLTQIWTMLGSVGRSVESS